MKLIAKDYKRANSLKSTIDALSNFAKSVKLQDSHFLTEMQDNSRYAPEILMEVMAFNLYKS